jgi:hypothetical protein
MTILAGQAISASDFIGSTGYVVSEITTGTTHSLTTNGSQKVIVWAKGNAQVTDGATTTLLLKYNGTTKDTVVQDTTNTAGTTQWPFALMYTETPSAGTYNITVEGATLNNTVIMVLKLLNTS